MLTDFFQTFACHGDICLNFLVGHVRKSFADNALKRAGFVVSQNGH